MDYITPQDVKKLIKKHSSEPFNARDAALIAAVGMGYFSAVELSLVCVKHMVEENGKLVVHDYLPEEFSYQNRPRKFFVGKKTPFRTALEEYIVWRKDKGFGLLNRQIFNGLDPESRFFLKDDGSQFDVNYKRRYEGDTAVQALQIQRHFKKFFLGADVSFKNLQESFLHSVWNELGSGTRTVKRLMPYTNLTPETIKAKCTRDSNSFSETMEKVFR